MNANTSATLKNPPPHSLINIGEYLYGFQITEAITLDEHTSQYLARSNESTYNQVPREVVIRLANLPYKSESRSLLEKEIEAYKTLYDKGGSRYIPHLLKTVQGDEQILIREFIYGVPLQELFQFIRQGPIISEECILELGLRLADATWGLLQKGVPYFQIQPEHILITPEGRIVLLSLGRESNLPLPYLPPEVMLSMPLDWRSNQWSIGMVMLALLLYNNDQEITELEEFDFHSLQNSCNEMNALLRSLIKNTQISPAIQMLLSEILQPSVGNRFEREDYFVQALLEAQSTIHNQTTLQTDQIQSLQMLGDFMWNHAPMLNSVVQRNTNSSNSKIPQYEIAYGHLTSDHNTNISRRKRIKQDILHEFISNTNKVPTDIQKDSITTLQMISANPDSSLHAQTDLKLSEAQIEGKTKSPLKTESSKNRSVQSSIHNPTDIAGSTLQSDNLPPVLNRDSVTEQPSDQQLNDSTSPQDSLNHNSDASTQEIYIAGIHDSYDSGYLNTTELQFLITLDEVEKIEELNPNELERIPLGQKPQLSLNKNMSSPSTYQQIIHYVLPILFLFGTLYVLLFGSI